MSGFATPVTVVIPVRNEAATVHTVLRSLLGQTREPDEILVVDGGSADATLEHLTEFACTDRRVRVIEAGPATPGRGRNVGIEAAQGAWIALTDAGGWVDPEWLRELISAAERNPSARVVYGNYEPIVDSFFARCAALTYAAPRRRGVNGAHRGPSTISILLHREAWAAVGGFPDLRAGEDLIFFERVDQAHISIAWAPRAVAWWRMQPSLGATFRRFVVYSAENVRAGLQRRWHHRALRWYLLIAAATAGAVLIDARWLLAIPVAIMLRTAKSIWRHRPSLAEWLRTFNPAEFLTVLVILVTIDVATLFGWIYALLNRRLISPSER